MSIILTIKKTISLFLACVMMLLFPAGPAEQYSAKNEDRLVADFTVLSDTHIEGNNYDIRKSLLQYDDVMNTQREIIYKQRKEVSKKEQLPKVAILSLETPRCWHWSLYFDGIFYDPEHGVMEDFPEAKRKYYWEIKENIC